jgi:hypothetical protein
MARPNTAKSAELQVTIWFLEAGWELYTPIADLHGTDMVVKAPGTRNLYSVQVKHKQPGARNEGYIANYWTTGDAPFDFLVFIQPSKSRGVILHRSQLKKQGKSLQFFKFDTAGYSSGDVRPLFKDFFFDFSGVPHPDRGLAFVRHFEKAVEAASRA